MDRFSDKISQPETIFALSSGSIPAAIALVRLSGPHVRLVLETLTGGVPSPRRAVLRLLCDPVSTIPLDQAICLYYPGPASVTGEDVAELHLHGSKAVVEAVFNTLSHMDGLRPAEAGEFTRRSFDNGRMNLSEVEGLADLIVAETEGQRHQALKQMMGRLTNQWECWRESLLSALSLLEAMIDFSGEDLPSDLFTRAHEILVTLITTMSQALKQATAGEKLRQGLTCAIIGPSNAGKSTLFNALAGRSAAITHSQAGTTRDIIECHLNLEGMPLTILDTAGFNDESVDILEHEGMRRARMAAENSDLLLIVLDADHGALLGEELLDFIQKRPCDSLLILNKTDRSILPDWQPPQGCQALKISALRQNGLDELRTYLAQQARMRMPVAGTVTLNRVRHRLAVEEALFALQRGISQVLPELAAEDIRLALNALDRLIGKADIKRVLDQIFAEFCIGK